MNSSLHLALLSLALVLLLLHQSECSGTSPSYDYIIVGGGTAGCVVARRLADSSNNSFSILLLEEGPVFDPSVSPNPELPQDLTPRLESDLVSNPDAAFSWQSERNDYTYTSRTTAVRGRGLGGSSRLGGVFSQPVNYDFATWGIPGWTLADMETYVEKFQDVLTQSGRGGADEQSGPVQITSGATQSLTSSFLAAAAVFGEATGSSLYADPITFLDGENNLGVGSASFTQTATNVKVNAATAYLQSPPSNLVILQGAKVTKVLLGDLSTGGKVAYAVQYLVNGLELNTVFANKEIILSAGVYGTPGILEMSGIGDPSILQPLNIQSQVNLPGVGENYISKPEFEFVYNGNQLYPEQNLTALGDPTQTISYLTTGSGIYAQQFTGAILTSTLGAPYPQFNVEFSTVIPPFVYPENAIGVRIMVSSPASRGSVHIPSVNPNDYPSVSTNFYSQTQDVDVALAAAGIVSQLVALPPLSLTSQLLPGTNNTSQVYFYVATQSQNSHHAVGTAKMGLSGDSTAVVDSNLLVMGVSNLRVVDASIIPQPVTLYPIGVVYAIAERAADLIIASNYQIPIKTTFLAC